MTDFELPQANEDGQTVFRLEAGGRVILESPEHRVWAADIAVIAAEGMKPSAAAFLTEAEMDAIARWLLPRVNRPSSELAMEALRVVALGTLESGREIGEAVEDLRERNL